MFGVHNRFSQSQGERGQAPYIRVCKSRMMLESPVTLDLLHGEGKLALIDNTVSSSSQVAFAVNGELVARRRHHATDTAAAAALRRSGPALGSGRRSNSTAARNGTAANTTAANATATNTTAAAAAAANATAADEDAELICRAM
jgi:hypothetical protein